MDILESSSPLPHRMPTISVAQALQISEKASERFVSTGMQYLDFVLRKEQLQDGKSQDFHGGVERGQITEIYGPPGSGKTTLAMQITANALSLGERVAWIDTSSPLPGTRLSTILKSSKYSQSMPTSNGDDKLENLSHYFVPTLAHLMALTCHPCRLFPSSNTSLIVIDSISTLFSNAFSRKADDMSASSSTGTPTPSSRQWNFTHKHAAIQALISGLSKLSAIHNCAVLVINETFTKMRENKKAVLVSGIASTAWDSGLSTKLVLYRDWADDEGKHGARFLMVQKVGGCLLNDGERVIEYRITNGGLVAGSARPPTQQLLAASKRKYDDIQGSDFEDEGEDEDYGWADEDESLLPGMPPQWQGSEDILIRGDDIGGSESGESSTEALGDSDYEGG